MPYKTYTSGLTLKQPLPGTRDYYGTLDTDTYAKLSAHDHTGSGKGVQISTAAIASLAVTTAKLAADSVTGAKIQLGNNAWLRGRNAANSADVNLIKVNASDLVEVGANLWRNGTTFRIGTIGNWSVEFATDSTVLNKFQGDGTQYRKNHNGYTGSEFLTKTLAAKSTSTTPVNVLDFTVASGSSLHLFVKLAGRGDSSGSALTTFNTLTASRNGSGDWIASDGVTTIPTGTTLASNVNEDADVSGSPLLQLLLSTSGLARLQVKSLSATTVYHVMELTYAVVTTDA